MEQIETIVGKLFVRNDYDKHVIKEVITDHEYERWGEIVIRPAMTVIDCGAHIGSFTRLALAYQAHVLAIEADEENFNMLLKNTEGYGNLKLLKGVLWNGKPARFLKDKTRGELNKVSKEGVMTATITLDQVVEHFKIKQIDLLKMDIEGAEYEVLFNFKHLDIIKQLTLEWHYGSTRMAELILFLEKRNFKVSWLGGNGDWGKLQVKHI